MTNHPESHSELRELSVEECWQLVRSQSIGRFAANRRWQSPLVVPVNYIVDADLSLVFRTGEGAKLDAITHGLVAIEVDEVDPLHHVGWSVVVEGHAKWLHEADDDAEVETWAPGERPYVVRLRPSSLTGRRISLNQRDTDGRGYR